MNRRELIGMVGAAGAMEILGSGRAFAATTELQAAARDAWLLTVPLVEMATVRARILGRSPAGQHVGLNSLVHSRRLATPADRTVTTPNNDTLYSSGFVDLSRGPVTLSAPDPGRRYLSVAIMDMYTNNNVVLGARTASGPAGSWRLIGPGETSRDARTLRLATPHAWVLCRTLVDGPSDMAAAQAVQSGLSMTGPTVSLPPAYATRQSDWPAFFESADRLLKSDPPRTRRGLDAFERVRAAGASRDFTLSGYSAGDAAAIARGVLAAQQIVKPAPTKRWVDGWNYPPATLGQYGDDFLTRAAIAVGGLGALPLSEATYLRAAGDDNSGLYHGDGLYRFHLAEELPVDAFWSLTMYEATADGQFFLAANDIDRYSIGDRTPALKRAADGSIDIWIGRTDPGPARRSNWLPAPRKGPFMLSLRAYLPKSQLIDGRYRVPPIVPA